MSAPFVTAEEFAKATVPNLFDLERSTVHDLSRTVEPGSWFECSGSGRAAMQQAAYFIRSAAEVGRPIKIERVRILLRAEQPKEGA